MRLWVVEPKLRAISRIVSGSTHLRPLWVRTYLPSVSVASPNPSNVGKVPGLLVLPYMVIVSFTIPDSKISLTKSALGFPGLLYITSSPMNIVGVGRSEGGGDGNDGAETGTPISI